MSNASINSMPADPAYDWPAALTFLERRAIRGVEAVQGNVYRRTIRLDDAVGVVSVTHDPANRALQVGVSGGVTPRKVTKRLRTMFDLDADLERINADLARDPVMAALVAIRPAVRVFGGWDPFEVAMRTIIGQQVSVARARDLNGVLVERCGTVLPRAADGNLIRLFPTPRQVLDADLSAMGMPGARAVTLKTVAAAVIEDPALFDRGSSLDQTIAKLRNLRGIGEWTAHYIAMRACREPDAFPSSDVGLLRGAAEPGSRRPSPSALLARAEAWRPWRAYAAHHLWAVDPDFSLTGPGPNLKARDGVSTRTGAAILGT